MNTKTYSAEVEEYLSAVRQELADLSEEERAELLQDVAQHLEDVMADGTDVSLATRLGSPEEFAAELRAAAELPLKAGNLTDGISPVQPSWLGQLTTSLGTMWTRPAMSVLRSFVRDLKPAWWVLRGYLIVALPVLWSPNQFDDFPVPSVGGSRIFGGALITAAIVLSVMVGRRRLVWPAKLLVIAGNVTLFLSGLFFGSLAEARVAAPVVFLPAALEPSYVLESRHGPVTNIFPYAMDGTPLENVLLFDQDGRPLKSEQQRWWQGGCVRVPSPPLAADGVAVEFAYPKNYVLGPQQPGQACQSQLVRPTVPLPTFVAPSG